MSETFEQILERMHRRDAFEAEADAAGRTGIERERAAERDAEDAAFEAVVDRRIEFEIEFAAEVRALVAERGGDRPTTHDVARATANIASRWGREYDRWTVADILSRDPEPVGTAYRPIRASA